jgi:hypothetical protein
MGTGVPRASEKRSARIGPYIGLIDGASHNVERKNKSKVEVNDAQTISLAIRTMVVCRVGPAHMAFLSQPENLGAGLSGRTSKRARDWPASSQRRD